MYYHLIDFEWYLKNAPDIINVDTMMCPVATSTEARIYFWENIHKTRKFPAEELDCIRIRYVRSGYIKI